MLHRRLPLGVGLLALVLFVSAPAWAADSHQGKVVGVDDEKLTMTTMAGEHQHTHEVPPEATITCDGEPCSLADLKAGDTVTVTLDKQGEKMVVTKIEAK